MIATIAEVESILIGRTRGLLDLANISSTPDADASPRAYLADAIGYAIRKSGGTTAGLTSPTASDLATVDAAKDDQLLDLAELRTLDNGLGSWTEPDQAEGPHSQKLGGLATFYHDRAECLRKKAQEVYGVDAATPTVGGDGLGDFSDGGSGGATNAGTFAYF